MLPFVAADYRIALFHLQRIADSIGGDGIVSISGHKVFPCTGVVGVNDSVGIVLPQSICQCIAVGFLSSDIAGHVVGVSPQPNGIH